MVLLVESAGRMLRYHGGMRMRLIGGTLVSKRALGCAVLALTFGVLEGAGQGFRTEVINDPALNMKAYNVVIPADWKYQGTLQAGDSCDDNPTPVIRAYSPDGLSEYRRLPRFDWSWGNAPYAPPQKGDCLPLKNDVPAIEFAKSLAKMQGAKFDGEMPIDAKILQSFKQSVDADNAAIQRQAGQRPFRGDWAAARLEFLNGSFVIEEQLRVAIRCVRTNMPGFSGAAQYFRENCGADVRVLRAPKGKLDALVTRMDTGITGASADPQWNNAYNAARQKVINHIVDENRQRMQAEQAQFAQAQKVRAQQNSEYQASLQAGYAAHNAQAQQIQGQYADHNGKVMANMDAAHTPASDWVDYALDQQTVSGTGGTVKVSSGYSQVWANSSGQYYLTNNLNTNPNGAMPGEWTQQTQVHGNAKAY